MGYKLSDAELYEQDFLYPGHGFCSGCALPIILRHVFQIMGRDSVLVVTAGCLGSNNGVFPTSPMLLSTYNAPFPALGAAASGIRAGLDIQGKSDTQVIAIGGDGGIFDIGLQALSGSLERGDDILYICYDNEAYMNTGIQRSSASPIGSVTTTTPSSHPEPRPKKNLIEIIASHEIPYVASASVGFLDDLIEKLEKAKEIRCGPRFLHILSPCTVGWKYPAELTLKLSRLAVKTLVFPLVEIEEGNYRITYTPQPVLPLEDYLQSQGRFRHMGKDHFDRMEICIKERWEKLLEKAKTNSTK